MARTLRSSIIGTIEFENDYPQGITMRDAYDQAQEHGFDISFEEYEKRFREIENTHPCPSFAW